MNLRVSSAGQFPQAMRAVLSIGDATPGPAWASTPGFVTPASTQLAALFRELPHHLPPGDAGVQSEGSKVDSGIVRNASLTILSVKSEAQAGHYWYLL